MTAGRIGASGVEARHRGVRISRGAMLGSTIAIAGLAVVLAAPGLVATSDRPPAAVPARIPAVAAPASATPAATAGWPVLVVPRVSGPTGPADRTPDRRWSGRSWGLYMD